MKKSTAISQTIAAIVTIVLVPTFAEGASTNTVVRLLIFFFAFWLVMLALIKAFKKTFSISKSTPDHLDQSIEFEYVEDPEEPNPSDVSDGFAQADDFEPFYIQKKSQIVSIFAPKWLEVAQHEFVVIDLETTGLDAAFDCIVEICALRYVNGVYKDKFYTLVKPEFPIPREAQAIHGITDSKVADQPRMIDILPNLLAYLDGQLLVAHNAHFDVKFLETWAKRYGYNPEWKYVDTISVAKKILPGLENYKQKTVLDAIGYKQGKYHRSEDDCLGCAEIMLLGINSLS